MITNRIKPLNVLDVFSGSQNLRRKFVSNGNNVLSIDVKKYRNSDVETLIMDFLDFDYTIYDPGHFDVLFFGLPCQAFSKASGNFHFDKDWNPKTDFANKSILLLKRVFEVIAYFKDAIFYIENPSGGLSNFPMMIEYVREHFTFLHRLHLGAYGFPTLKQTDIFTNNPILPILPKMYRKNGVYSKNKFDNLTPNKKHSYPDRFCDFIVSYTYQGYISNFNTNQLPNI